MFLIEPEVERLVGEEAAVEGEEDFWGSSTAMRRTQFISVRRKWGGGLEHQLDSLVLDLRPAHQAPAKRPEKVSLIRPDDFDRL